MRIVILVPYFPPKRLGGTEIATYNIARHLAKNGHEVHVITPIDEDLPRKSCENNFTIYRVGSPGSSLVSALNYIAASYKIVKKIDPEVIHSQSLLRTGLTAYLLKKILKYPYVVYGRGADVYEPWLFKNILIKPILSNADAIIALTSGMAYEMKKYVNKDIFVIPNGIDIPERIKQHHVNVRNELNIPLDVKIVLFVGRLHKDKGLKDLIVAFSLLHKRIPETILLIIGDGNQRIELEQMTKELGLQSAVLLIGRVPYEKVFRYMEASEIFVLPSVAGEGFPNVFLEAMSAGLPIISTKFPGFDEIIKECENGYLVPPSNSQQLFEKMLLILNDDTLRLNISIANLKKAEIYSWSNTVLSLENIYVKVVNR